MTREEKARFCIDNPHKSPAFQFYPESWFGSAHIAMMKDHERGIHACLIFSAWQEDVCGIKNDDETLQGAARSIDIESIKKVLKYSWYLYEGFWFSSKLCDCRINCVEISLHRTNSINSRWHKNRKKQRVNTNVLQMNKDVIQKDTNLKTEIELKIEKEEEIEIRKKVFIEQVLLYKDYPVEMLNNFIQYWSEPNRSNKKMKFELQETWSLSGRLSTWAKRDGSFKIPKKQFGRQEVSNEELREQMEGIELI
jgi:hypothetical protein